MSDTRFPGLDDSNTNLPLLLTSFIGRERERAEVLRLLAAARLLTLTGPPGCGKTRLALETGHSLLEQYSHGVWLVDLTQTGDPQAVPRLAAQALELVILGDTDVEMAIIEYLRSRSALLILDNCEHVLEAAAHLCITLLTHCPGVKVLATSQMPLGVPGEQEWLVPSLPLPEPEEGSPLTPPMLRQYGAVQLFEDRAANALPGFCLDEANAQAVVEICRRLDGIPLAIELAAARVKLFSAREIAQRLEDRFDLLAAPRRMVSSRHQTLRSAIDWSFNLLEEAEQILLTRLAVFTGSFDLEAAHHACGYEPLAKAEVPHRLGELVDRSLVVVQRQEGQQTRYRLLDSIRLYGLDRLTQEESSHLQNRHLDYYTQLAKQYNSDFSKHAQVYWLDRLEADWPNIRAAVNWALEDGGSQLYKGLQLLANLEYFLRLRNHIREPEIWIRTMLARADANDSPDWIAARAHAHYILGLLIFSQEYGSTNVLEQLQVSRQLWKKLGPRGLKGYVYPTIWLSQLEHIDFTRANALLEECREIWMAENDLQGTATILLQEGQIAERIGNFALAEQKFRMLLAFATQHNNSFFTGLANRSLNSIMQAMNRHEEALAFGEQTLQIAQGIGSVRSIVTGSIHMIETYIALNHLERAEELIEQTTMIQDKMDIQFNRPDIIYSRGEICLLKSNFRAAAPYLHRAARWHFAHNYWPGFFAGCMALAAALAEENPDLAARIYGFAQKTAGTVPEGLVHANTQAVISERLDLARRLLGAAAFEQAVVEGAGCTLDELIPPEGAGLPQPAPLLEISPRKLEKARFSGLTRREREIAGRIARGLTNPAIASDLMISERTVTTHVTNILSKLGFTSRTQIAAWAAEKGLVPPSDSQRF